MLYVRNLLFSRKAYGKFLITFEKENILPSGMNLEAIAEFTALQQEAQRMLPGEEYGAVFIHTYREFMSAKKPNVRAAYLLSMDLGIELAKTQEGKEQMQQLYEKAVKAFIYSFVPEELCELKERCDTDPQRSGKTYQNKYS